MNMNLFSQNLIANLVTERLENQMAAVVADADSKADEV